MVVFKLCGVVRHCSVLWCVALCVATRRALRVTSIAVLLHCAVFHFVFLLGCAFRGVALCHGAWYSVLSRGVGLRHVASCGALSCFLVL